jgi:outer membrane protein assembly factor BamB
VGPNGTIYIGSWDQKIYAYSQAGVLKWSINPHPTGRKGFMRTSPIIDKNGHIFVYYDRDLSVADSAPHLYKLQDNGSSVTKLSFDWTPSFGGANARAIATPAIGTDNRIYVATFFENATDKRGHLYAVSTSTASEAWAFPGSGESCVGPIMANPVIAQDGTIYISTQKGVTPWYTVNPHVFALNPVASLTSTERVRWHWPVDGVSYSSVHGQVPTSIGAIDSAPAIGADGTVYIPVDSPTPLLAAVSSEGEFRWPTLTRSPTPSSQRITLPSSVRMERSILSTLIRFRPRWARLPYQKFTLSTHQMALCFQKPKCPATFMNSITTVTSLIRAWPWTHTAGLLSSPATRP